MRRKIGIWKKSLSLFLAASMLAGTASVLSGCGIGSSKNKTIKLDVYSQLANSSGMQTGWSAQILN